MNWIVSAILMFFSSNVLYLLVRKTQKENLPNFFINLGMFLVPSTFFLIVIGIFHLSLILSPQIYLILILTAFLFSYLGNIFSLKSIALSANPGYSLIIAKSYVVFTTLVAVVLFHSHLNLKSALAIILIVAFSSLIAVSKTKIHQHKNHWWLIYALGAFLCWGMLALVSKYLVSEGLNIFIYLFYLTGFVTIFLFAENIILKKKYTYDLPKIKNAFLIGIFATFLNLFMQLGYLLAPNPGYINAVNASSISLLTLLSAYFFKDELTVKKIVGVVGVTMGLIILLV